MLRILIIDDNPGFLNSISALLGRFPDVSVVGVAIDGEHGLRVAAELSPDMVFVDLNMPGMSGMEVTERLRRRQPQLRVVIVSLNDGADYRERAAAVGAERFVRKADLFVELSAIFGRAAAAPKAYGAAP